MGTPKDRAYNEMLRALLELFLEMPRYSISCFVSFSEVVILKLHKGCEAVVFLEYPNIKIPARRC